MKTEILTCTNSECGKPIEIDPAMGDEANLGCPHCGTNLGMLCDVRAAETRAAAAQIGDAVSGGITVVKGLFSGLRDRLKSR